LEGNAGCCSAREPAQPLPRSGRRSGNRPEGIFGRASAARHSFLSAALLHARGSWLLSAAGGLAPRRAGAGLHALPGHVEGVLDRAGYRGEVETVAVSRRRGGEEGTACPARDLGEIERDTSARGLEAAAQKSPRRGSSSLPRAYPLAHRNGPA